MDTPPFGAVLEAALKKDIQGGRLETYRGRVITPRAFCCMSGAPVGVNKVPVAILHVSPTQACTGNTITADFEHSYSPTSTLAAYEVDWGDGNTTGQQAWPPAGPWTVTHQYTLPGTYYVTLTVIDLLGARGEDTVQVTIVDCTVMPGFEAYAGCGSSGPWYTANGGLGWENIGAGILDDVAIYDLKVSPATHSQPVRRLWAVTETGLFRGHHSTSEGASWEGIALPIPEGANERPAARMLSLSPVGSSIVFVTATVGTEIWVYRSLDDGETWNYVPISTGPVETPLVPDLTIPNVWGTGLTGHKFAVWGGTLYVVGAYRYNDATETWVSIGRDGLTWVAAICASGTRLCQVGLVAGAPNQSGVRFWNGSSWITPAYCAGQVRGDTDCVYHDGKTYTVTQWGTDAMYRFDGTEVEYGDTFSRWGADCNPVFTWAGPDRIHFIGDDFLVALSWLTGTRILRSLGEICNAPWLPCLGESWDRTGWDIEWSLGVGRNIRMFDHSGITYATVGGVAQLLQRTGTSWAYHSVVCPQNINCGRSYGGSIYVGAGNSLYRLAGVTYVEVCQLPAGENVDDIINHNGTWHLYCRNGNVYHCECEDCATIIGPAYTISNVGRFHLSAMSGDGYYYHFGLISPAGTPAIVRVTYNLEIVDIVHLPASGTWGGVRGDSNLNTRLWVFGDFGAASKVLMSDDDGNNFTDVTDGTWGATEIVRPILPSLYGSADVVAVLNTALQMWQSMDDGNNWTNNGNISFSCHCAERDFIDDWYVFIGRVDEGGLHLQLTPNAGASWEERSSGITGSSQITAIQIVG